MSNSKIKVTGGCIKGYHVFKIKAPVGMKIIVEEEHGNPDPNAMKCMLPPYCEMGEKERETVMQSTSSKKQYRVGDKAGEQIGRVQFFLNTAFKELLHGDAETVYGIVTGLPTTTRGPRVPVNQRWNHRREGGGAIIPCEWFVICSSDKVASVVRKINETIAKIEGGKEKMHVSVINDM